MSETLVRPLAFLCGLLGLGLVETLAPHHAPTVSRTPRWIVNLSLGVLNAVIVWAACLICVAASATASGRVSLLPFSRLSPGLRLLAEVLALDLVTYLLHRAYHVVPLLWRLHAAHHTDLDLDVSSASRFHPGEVLLSSVVKVVVVVLLGVSPLGFVAFEVVMLLCAQFQHANVSVPPAVERWLWLTLVPPAMHRIHHTPARQDTDSNYGTLLTFWDHLFGSLRFRERDRGEPFGIERGTPAPRLADVLLVPFRSLDEAAAGPGR